MSPIIGIQRRLREVGRIRIGQQVPAGKGKTRPEKLDTFRITSPDPVVIKQAAAVYGGTPRQWEDAPIGEQWEVITERKALSVLVPPTELAFSQFYELWGGGGCKRRCDGEREFISDEACLCDPENRECSPHTRLSLILTELDGIGTFRLDTQGFYAAAELSGAIEIVRLAQDRGRMIPARLLLEKREVKRPGEPPKQFVVPALDLVVSVASLTGSETPGLVPIPAPEAPADLATQLKAVEAPPAPPQRANTAAPLPPTGRRPRKAVAASTGPSEAPVRPSEAPVGAPKAPAPVDGWASDRERAEAHHKLAERIRALDPRDRAWCRTYREEHSWPLSRADFDALVGFVEEFEEARDAELVAEPED